MKKDRRDFLKVAGLTGVAMAGGIPGLPNPFGSKRSSIANHMITPAADELSGIIGPIGPWASALNEKTIPLFSFRKAEFSDVAKWKTEATARTRERLGIPDLGTTPAVKTLKKYTFDGLQIEELVWQLPYGAPTEAILVRPANQSGRLPGILAFHDHGGNKYFGTRKITRTSATQHPLMVEHQREYYSGKAWANEIARRGYVVLVSDAFTFASRRVLLADVPADIRQGLTDKDPENPESIKTYNQWAGQHEHIMAKSLFCLGTTWPGVFFAEDQQALNILSSRNDVDPDRIGCAGLSGGGLRTVFMGGLEPRIKCAVCVGFMSTWKDFALNKSFTHTWMTYVPRLPGELDFPEILGLRTPLPTLVLNDSDDFLYTLPEMKRADTILGDVYRKAKAPDRYKCSFYPGPHKFDAQMQDEAFNWFDKWLKV